MLIITESTETNQLKYSTPPIFCVIRIFCCRWKAIFPCYTARFKRAFPDFESCQNYVQKKRNYVEPVYNPKRLLEPTHMELERKVSEEYAKDSKVEVQKAVQLLREAVLVKKQPSIDLTESDVEEYQEALNTQMVNLSIDEEIEAELLMHNELYAALVKGEPLNAENSVINLPDVSVRLIPAVSWQQSKSAYVSIICP